MKVSDSRNHLFRICVAAALLSGCRGGGVAVSPSLPVPGAEAARSGASHFVSATGAKPLVTEKVLYSFGSGTDGSGPLCNLIDVKGTLYGTTLYGGAHGDGTIFSVSTAGKEKVLYSFGSGTDGIHPIGGLIDAKGTLYGTTVDGGAHGDGTVFSVSSAGKEKVLYSFSGADGAHPEAKVIGVKGTLYGTTLEGGAYGDGTVFSISTTGTLKVLHSFRGITSQGADGAYPVADLIHVSNTLYGTTFGGGAVGSGHGTVFSISTAGREKVLYSFGAGNDGTQPQAALIDINGTLYGTTVHGGRYCLFGKGCGTVFSITTGGTERVLYSFRGPFFGHTDGDYPSTGLIDVTGTLYGTTNDGGAYCSPFGCGTAFSITTGGTESVLHSFGADADGAYPGGGLIDINGTLYGTTVSGGTNSGGTVFALTP